MADFREQLIALAEAKKAASDDAPVARETKPYPSLAFTLPSDALPYFEADFERTVSWYLSVLRGSNRKVRLLHSIKLDSTAIIRARALHKVVLVYA